MSKRDIYCKHPTACIAGLRGKCKCMSEPSQKELHTSEYYAWTNMKTRCSNPKYPQHHRYSDRGIAVCESWKKSFEAFLRDVGKKPSPGMILDRIRNSKGYEPGNVRWVTVKESSLNRDVVKQYEAFGKSLNLPEWEELSQRSRKTIWRRVDDGWPIDMAIAAPPMPHHFRHQDDPIAAYERDWRSSQKAAA